MQQAIEEAKARLMAGHNADEVLRQFAEKVKGRACPNCGLDDLCFACKVTDVLGDKATMAFPLLIPKVAAMIKEWHAGRPQRKAQEEAAARARRRRPPPPPRGGQRF